MCQGTTGPVDVATGIITPGAYLRLRREAARMGIRQVAAELAALPFAVMWPGPAEIARLAARIGAAEDDTEPFTLAEAELLQHAFRFDWSVYAQLIDLHADPASDGTLPVPQICRSCGCSWHDPCVRSGAPCAWTDHNAELCTACAHRPAPSPGLHLAGASGEGAPA
ncbi:conserved hypothetical protein [Altererythrobacter sp. B11]|uniref:hypothetical protein n=1 Tax=Altererythrobacter sp. B11 TaxID=2060312 RepID=UPI000DC71CCC|nr:hypothetical protein [Altererythrobacter sp. B11]BBC72894.1 conserved hypothetical protein [Altererythrobacter sp. B11]